MFDEKIDLIIKKISDYLDSIGFVEDIKIDDIINHPNKSLQEICFLYNEKENAGNYIIFIFSSYEKNVSFIKEKFMELLKRNSPRSEIIKLAMSKDDAYLFIFAVLHEVGHIHHHIKTGRNNEIFFNSDTGYNSRHNLKFEKYADQYAVNHIDKIYKLYIDGAQ